MIAIELQQNPSFLDLLQKDTNPKNQQQPLNTTGFQTCKSQPARLVGRPGGRPTSSTDRPGAQQRVGYFQSVDRAVDRSCLCACCARRSTGPVDRAGRPSTFYCCLAISWLLLPSSFVIDFLGDHSTTPRRSLSTSSAILLSFQQFSTSAKIFSKSEPISNIPQSITWRNRHTISA